MESPGIIYDQQLFRRDVRRDVRNCALFILFFYAVNLIASMIVQMIYIFSNPGYMSSVMGMTEGIIGGGSAEVSPDLIEGMTEGNILGLMSIVGMVAGSCVFFIYRKKRFITDIFLPAAEPLTPKIFLMLVVITQGVQGVYSMIVMLVDYLLPGGLSLQESYSEIMEGLFTPVGLLYIILIGPIFEELIFRGAIMGALKRFGVNFAILFSSLLFGFYHAVILQIPFAFVLGLLLGYVAARWSLRAAIALHIVVNGLSCLLSVSEAETFQTVSGIAMLACAGVAVIMAVKWRNTLKARISDGAAYYKGTYAHGFSSIAFWIFLVIMTAFGLWQMYAVAALI
jgi:membrane protease YdiL (CAAX protease family)